MLKTYLLGIAMLLSAGVAQSAVQRCAADGPLANFATSAYGDRIEFDVYRNDKLVGEHITEFDTSDNGLTVSSAMNLTIKVLFVPVYEFKYSSSELWCNESLLSLQASTDRNGKISNVALAADSHAAVIRDNDGERTVTGDFLPTNHWNPAVLEKTMVFNTITGGVNQVAIGPCRSGSEIIERAAPNSACYQYSGELQTRAWYDDQKRWVGLQFKGDDGSTISYVCRVCRQ